MTFVRTSKMYIKLDTFNISLQYSAVSEIKVTFLYSTVSRPWDCSKRFTLHPLGRPVHSNASQHLRSIQAEIIMFTEVHIFFKVGCLLNWVTFGSESILYLVLSFHQNCHYLCALIQTNFNLTFYTVCHCSQREHPRNTTSLSLLISLKRLGLCWRLSTSHFPRTL